MSRFGPHLRSHFAACRARFGGPSGYTKRSTLKAYEELLIPLRRETFEDQNAPKNTIRTQMGAV